MKMITMIAGVAAAMMVSGGYVPAADEAAEAKKDAPAAEKKAEVKVQTKCPVMGGDIDKSIYADHDGKRVYFCCGGCDKKFKKNPEKYIKKLEDDGVTIDKTPVKEEPKAKEEAKDAKAAGK